MKKQVITFLATAFLASISFGQNMSQTRADAGISSKGIRVSLIKPTLDMKAKAKYQGLSFEATGKPDSAWGVGIGYASLPVQELGWTTNLSMIEAKAERSSNMVRVDGNLGCAFNKYVNLKAGLNATKFTSGDGVKDLNPGVGFQASLGLQLNRNVGIDVGYSESNVSGDTPVTSNGKEIGKANSELKLSGLEIALTATF